MKYKYCNKKYTPWIVCYQKFEELQDDELGGVGNTLIEVSEAPKI